MFSAVLINQALLTNFFFQNINMSLAALEVKCA